MMKTKVLFACAAVVLAIGLARSATGVTFSGYVGTVSTERKSVDVSVEFLSTRGEPVSSLQDVFSAWMETNGFLSVTVPCAMPTNAVSVRWTFVLDDQSTNVVSQTLACAPYALVAERAEKVVPDKRSLTVPGSLTVQAADALRTLSVGEWGAPGSKVVLGGGASQSFAIHSLTTRLDVVRTSMNCPTRVKLLGAANTNGAVHAEIRGGVSVADECSFKAPSDGILEVTLKGVVSYSRNSAYGDYPNQDGFCHVCAMVGLNLTDVNNHPLMPEVFDAFRPGDGMSSKLVCRPWIVPSDELAEADGRMSSRLTVPMRRGDTFRACLEFANFKPAEDESVARSFTTMQKASWVDGGSWATAELVFRSIGGGK